MALIFLPRGRPQNSFSLALFPYETAVRCCNAIKQMSALQQFLFFALDSFVIAVVVVVVAAAPVV